MKKLISIVLAAFFAASLSFSLQAAENPFGISDLERDAHLSMSSEPDGKCGEGKCGEAKCGGDKKKESKCGEGKCGGDKKKDSKCGEGKCGGN